ncbi:hypothetical protein V5T82_16375 [Magnetovibrio sp. PR-2]|uniref:hypothetical protein n=1 Tax=Magnetovibrio sp. PR-2 TaxID=3120356 RepID=UPI002FCE2FCC
MYLLKMSKATSIPSTMAGKTFTIGKVTAAGKGAGKWLLLQPKAASAAAAAKGSVMLKMEGTRQLAGLVGKTVTVGKAPVMGAGAGAGKWLALHPVAAKGAAAAGGGVSAILTAAKAPVAGTVAKTGAATGVAKTAAVGAAAGTIWNGTGMSLGLGLGLGALGPALLAGGVAAGGYYLYNRSKNAEATDEDIQDEAALA